MIGGFLGAGKTTAVLALARRLTAEGKRVGLITNDQSVGLVDTRLLAHHGFDVAEITGGCFCCRFNSLVDASEQLSAETRPDVFIAEPVGSCTDLVAAVSYPLRRIYGDRFRVAPLSVLVDPSRALRVLGIEPGRAFSSKVTYVYTKQLEEAEMIIINKADMLDDARRDTLCAALAQRFPQASQHVVSAREATGLDPWFDQLRSADAGVGPTPEVDYEVYAEGEARLGWFNATVALEGPAFDGNRLLVELARDAQRRLRGADIAVAHLKMTLEPGELGGDIGVVNLVSDEGEPEQSHHLAAPLEAGELIINLRAEGDPEAVRSLTFEALDSSITVSFGGSIGARVVHEEHFRPAPPEPTHRMTTSG